MGSELLRALKPSGVVRSQANELRQDLDRELHGTMNAVIAETINAVPSIPVNILETLCGRLRPGPTGLRGYGMNSGRLNQLAQDLDQFLTYCAFD